MGEQAGEDLLEAVTVGEGDISGDLGLISDPPVATEAGPADPVDQRVVLAGQGVEQAWPAPPRQLVCQRLGRLPVLAGDDRVRVAGVADPGFVQRPAQRLTAVHPDLDLEGEPALHPDMTEPELGVDAVEVDIQALATATDDLEAMGARVLVHVEAAARADCGEHADQALGDPVSLCDRSGQVLFRAALGLGVGRAEIDVGPPGVRSHGLGVCFQLVGACSHVGAEVLEQHPLGVQEALERPGRVQLGDVTLDDQPVEADQRASDAILVHHLERGHGPVPPASSSDVFSTRSSAQRRPRGQSAPPATRLTATHPDPRTA